MSAYDLELEEIAPRGIVVARLSGELDLTNARELEERLDDAPAGSVLVLDLNRVSFIDSAALHVVFKIARRRGEGGLAIALDPDAAVARTVEIAGLHKAVTLAPSLEALDFTQAR